MYARATCKGLRRMYKPWSGRWRSYRRQLTIAGIAASLIAAGAVTAYAQSDPGVGLRVTSQPTMTGDVQLTRAKLNGPVYIFVKGGSETVSSVKYWINDPVGATDPTEIASASPFAFPLATKPARACNTAATTTTQASTMPPTAATTTTGSTAFDTTLLCNGWHNVLAQITTSSGTKDLFARFQVNNTATTLPAANLPTETPITPTVDAGTTLGTDSGTTAPPAQPVATKPAATAATGKTVPVGAVELTNLDFNKDTLDKWGNCQAPGINGNCGAGTKHVSVVKGKGPNGTNAGRFLIEPNQEKAASGERSEIRVSGANTKSGDERWYEFSLMFPKAVGPQGDWFIIMQWHPGSGSPGFTVSVKDGKIVITGHQHDTLPLGTIRPGQWSNYVVHANFSSNGWVEGWENGVQTVKKTNYAMASDTYLKIGIYRDPGQDTVELYYGRLRITGPSGSSSAAEGSDA